VKEKNSDDCYKPLLIAITLAIAREIPFLSRTGFLSHRHMQYWQSCPP